MERIWAPWRLVYIKADKTGECVFCHAAAHPELDRENFLLWRGEHAFVILNRFPYSNGHLLVLPYQHVASIEALDGETLTEMMGMAQRCLALLRRTLRPDGFNIGINLGEAAGAGIAAHVHMHIVPRWNCDTNFMPVLANTRVIPEFMESTYETLMQGMKEM